MGDEMSISKRQELILKLLHEYRHMTVKKLAQTTYASPSSIRRDLTHLQNMCYIKRTHGGASILDGTNRVEHLNSRMSKNIKGKRKIALKASTLLEDGQSIMLDGSTTASFLIPYIAKHKDVTLFTNSMITAINAVNMGIKTHCTGGLSVNGSAVLSSETAYNTVKNINPDILFFSSQCIDINGMITDSTAEENYLRQLMIESAKKRVFLCDSEKFNTKSLYKLVSIDDIDIAVFDEKWDELNTKCWIL